VYIKKFTAISLCAVLQSWSDHVETLDFYMEQLQFPYNLTTFF